MYLEISGRRSGKTVRLQNAIRKWSAEAGLSEKALLLVPTLNMAKYVTRDLDAESKAQLEVHSTNTFTQRLNRHNDGVSLDTLRYSKIFLEEFDCIDTEYIWRNSRTHFTAFLAGHSIYACATPIRMRKYDKNFRDELTGKIDLMGFLLRETAGWYYNAVSPIQYDYSTIDSDYYEQDMFKTQFEGEFTTVPLYKGGPVRI